MDFNKFVEHDILGFLDSEAKLLAEKIAEHREEESGLFDVNKDYSKETALLLADGNLVRAKKLLQDLESRYAGERPDSHNKKKLSLIIEDVLSQIRVYEEKEVTQSGAVAHGKHYPDPARQHEPAQEQYNPQADEDKAKEALAQIEEGARIIRDTLAKDSLTKQQIADCARNYHKLKEITKSLPQSRPVEKARATSIVHSLHQAISEAHELLKEKNPAEAKIDKTLEMVTDAKREMIQASSRLDLALQKSNIKSAKSEYSRMKNCFDKIPDDMVEEKKSMAQNIVSQYQKIKAFEESMAREAELDRASDLEKMKASITRSADEIAKEREPAASLPAKSQQQPLPGKEQENKNNQKDQNINPPDSGKFSLPTVPDIAQESINDPQAKIVLQELKEAESALRDLISKKDIPASIAAYKKVKSIAEDALTILDEDSREDVMADVLALHHHLKKMEHESAKKRHHSVAAREDAVEDKQKRLELKEELAVRTDSIKLSLQERDIAKAMQEYRELKAIFKDYPEHPVEEKQTLYQNILAVHKDILLLENDFKRKNPALTPEKKDDIGGLLKQAHELLDEGRTAEATSLILEAKHKINMLPRDAFDEKYKFIKDIEGLEHKTVFVKNIIGMKAQQS